MPVITNRVVCDRVSASSSRHVRSFVPGARHCSLPFGSTSRLSQMECRSYWKFPIDAISQEMIQVTRHTDFPQRKAPSRSKPALFQITTPLSAPNASIARESCSSQGSSAARPAESTAHLSRTTCTATSCCQVARCIHMRRDSRTIAQLHQYALLWALRISWLCPEHDLKLFTCFCVSPGRKIRRLKTQKASLCSRRFTYVSFIIRSTRTEVFGLDRIYPVFPLYFPAGVVFKRRVR